MEHFTRTPALQQEWILEATWTDIPEDVHKEIENLWTVIEYGNDHYYFAWKSDEEWWYDGDGDQTYEQRFPAIGNYLKENNIEECLIHYWW